MTAKRILVATGIYPPDIGGPATMVESMAVGLRERGYSCSVLTYGDTSGRMTGGTESFRSR